MCISETETDTEGKESEGNPIMFEIELKDREFQKLSNLIFKKAGIYLHEGKKGLVKARMGKILREGGFKSFNEYLRHVQSDKSGQELIRLIDRISTNHTFFFREADHFDFLKERVVPEFLKNRVGIEPLRVWSSACSSGEEPYSIAITLLEMKDRSFDFQIIATDISTEMLKTAQRGIYKIDRVKGLSGDILKRYFKRGINRWKGYIKIKEDVKRYVQFQRVNLMEDFNFKEPFHVIFCRNVMIYFKRENREYLVNRLYRYLKKGGYLIIGHSESLHGIKHPFRYIRSSIYQR